MSGQRALLYNLARRVPLHGSVRTTMYYNKPQRNMDEQDMLRGLDAERAAEKSFFFKMFDKYADAYYRFVYKYRPNSSFPKIFEANKFCRMIAVDGIPGSGFEQVGHDLAKEQHMLVRERPRLYYLWERFGRADSKCKKALTESGDAGGMGNWWQEQYRMSWENVYNNPGDWRELCKTLSWQLRSFRIQESDTLVEHLLQMQGTVNIQNYFSYRAEVHACGETGRIPPDMHQSFIDQWNHMEGAVFPYPVMVYIDCDPEIAYKNIQNSDSYTPEQKAWYTLDYLKAYKEGYEEFVLPHMSSLETIIFKFEPQQIPSPSDMCEIMLTKEPDMVHFANQWHMYNSFMQTNQVSEKYITLLATHMDIGQNQNMTTRITTAGTTLPENLIWFMTPMARDKENYKAKRIIDWKYPREGIDGFGWHWDNMNQWNDSQHHFVQPTVSIGDAQYMNCIGDGYVNGQNEGDENYSTMSTLFNSTHRQIRGGADFFPGMDLRGRGIFFKQSV